MSKYATSPVVQGGEGWRRRRSHPRYSVGWLLLFDVLAHNGNRRASTGRSEAGQRLQNDLPVAFLDISQ